MGRHDPITPAGELEQLGKLISGLSRQKGWRRWTAWLAVTVVLLVMAVVIVSAIIH